MAYLWKKIWRKKPGAESSTEGKFYITTRSVGRVTLNQLAKEAGDLTSVNQTDVKAVLDAVMQIIPTNLAKGLRVELGDIGTITLSTKSNGKDKLEDLTAREIHTVRPRLIAGKALKDAAKQVTFEHDHAAQDPVSPKVEETI